MPVHTSFSTGASGSDLCIDYNFLQTSMNALLLETMVGVSTFASTQWAATTVTVQQDSLYPWMRERAKVGIHGSRTIF